MTPNLYQLRGPHVHVTYATTGIDGKPSMTYQDAHAGKSFRGDDVRLVECDLGTLVSVTLRNTTDMGSTSLSVFIPRMRIQQGETVAVHTECVTALHSSSIAPQTLHGQLDTYHVVALHGSAQHVVF